METTLIFLTSIAEYLKVILATLLGVGSGVLLERLRFTSEVKRRFYQGRIDALEELEKLAGQITCRLELLDFVGEYRQVRGFDESETEWLLGLCKSLRDVAGSLRRFNELSLCADQIAILAAEGIRVTNEERIQGVQVHGVGTEFRTDLPGLFNELVRLKTKAAKKLGARAW